MTDIEPSGIELHLRKIAKDNPQLVLILPSADPAKRVDVYTGAKTSPVFRDALIREAYAQQMPDDDEESTLDTDDDDEEESHL